MQGVLESHRCVSPCECVIPVLFLLPCSLADCWQTQSLCYHKELMKRTLGKPTHAFEARDYVVSPPVIQVLYSHSQNTNPLDSAKTGDTGAAGTLQPTDKILWGKERALLYKCHSYFSSEMCIEKL